MTVDATFIEMIDRNLSYFKELFESDDASFNSLNTQQEGLRRSIQFGAKSADTNAKAADLFINSFTFIQQQGNYQPWVRTAIRLANHFQDSDQYLLTRVVSSLGFLQQELGQTEKAEHAFRSAERLALENEDTAAVASAWYYLGVLEYRNYRSEQAKVHLEQAKLLFESELDLEDKDNKRIYGFVLNLLGLISQQGEDYKVAEAYFKQAEIIFNTLDSDHLSTLTDINLSYLYARMGDLEKAEQKLFSVAAYAVDKGLILRHADVVFTLSEIYIEQERWQEAYDAVNTIKIAELQKRGQLRHVALAKNDLGNSSTWLGRYDEALMYLSEALPLWDQLGDEVQYANSYGSMGHAYAELGEWRKAKHHYTKALKIMKAFNDEFRVQRFVDEFETSLQRLTKKKSA